MVGAINVDLVVAAGRLPGPGETVVGARVERHGGGKGANAAVAAARAGAAVRLVGAVGADENGASALSELRAQGVGVGDVAVLDGEATGVALIVVDPEGENQIAVGAGANAAVTADQVGAALQDALPGAGCVLVSTEIPGDAVAAAVQAATAAGVPCVLNPAPVIPEVVDLLAHGPLLTPNATEIAELAAMLGQQPAGMVAAAGEEALGATGGGATGAGRRAEVDGARMVVARTGAPVVITLGGDGVLVLTPDGQVDHVPPTPVTVRDTTGAGDTFNGVLAARIAAGDRLDVAVRVATTAASLSVAQLGARDGMPDAVTIEAALRTT
ncbi:Ribokinase [Carbonactinospora thermoautotrophica]|uniref:Ribokinase n=1 Tax=Carbonactinospora thermoautotrophica TaxID=1469144 RepID=A0A132MH82_9ACTN|nr:Ribokinase [Carbonactinospora thermoautotrophica]